MRRTQSTALVTPWEDLSGEPLPEPLGDRAPAGETASRWAVGALLRIRPAPRGELWPTRLLGHMGAGRSATRWTDRGLVRSLCPCWFPNKVGAAGVSFLDLQGTECGVSDKLGPPLRVPLPACAPQGPRAGSSPTQMNREGPGRALPPIGGIRQCRSEPSLLIFIQGSHPGFTHSLPGGTHAPAARQTG